MKKQLLYFYSLIIGVTAVLCLTGCENPFGKDEEKSLIEQGNDAIESGDYSGAASLFEQAIVDGEDERLSRRGKGMALLAAGDYQGAQKAFKEALALSNGIIKDIDIDIAYYMAVAEYRAGDAEAAIKTYDSILAIRPEEDNAYYMRGKANLMQGRKDKAIQDYESAVTLAPQDYDHYLRICEDLRDNGYVNEGDEYLRRAMDSGNKLSDYQLGVFNYYLGNYTEARNYLENAKDAKKKSEDLIIYLGRCYEELGDMGYAMTLYENYIAEDGSEKAGAYVRLGICKMKQSDYKGALDTFEAGLALGGGSYQQSLLYNRIVAYEYLRDFATAKNLMAEYVARYPSDEKAARENQFLSTR